MTRNGRVAPQAHAAPRRRPRAGLYIGVAPEANLVSVTIADDGGATALDAIFGLQFVVDHKDELLDPATGNIDYTRSS